jgi:inner membrane protein involved in colicin E2 resistance
MDLEPENTEKKSILSPLQWWLSASAVFALVIVPLTVAAFYMLNITKRVADYPIQYNPIVGIVVGIVLSLAIGYFYSGVARKHAE